MFEGGWTKRGWASWANLLVFWGSANSRSLQGLALASSQGMTTPCAGDAFGVHRNAARSEARHPLRTSVSSQSDAVALMTILPHGTGKALPWSKPLLCGSYSGHRHHVGSQASAVISASGVKTPEPCNLFCSWLQFKLRRLWIHHCLSPPITTAGRRASWGTSTLLHLVFLAASQLAPLPPFWQGPKA